MKSKICHSCLGCHLCWDCAGFLATSSNPPRILCFRGLRKAGLPAPHSLGNWHLSGHSFTFCWLARLSPDSHGGVGMDSRAWSPEATVKIHASSLSLFLTQSTQSPRTLRRGKRASPPPPRPSLVPPGKGVRASQAERRKKKQWTTGRGGGSSPSRCQGSPCCLLKLPLLQSAKADQRDQATPTCFGSAVPPRSQH